MNHFSRSQFTDFFLFFQFTEEMRSRSVECDLWLIERKRVKYTHEAAMKSEMTCIFICCDGTLFARARVCVFVFVCMEQINLWLWKLLINSRSQIFFRSFRTHKMCLSTLYLNQTKTPEFSRHVKCHFHAKCGPSSTDGRRPDRPT